MIFPNIMDIQKVWKRLHELMVWRKWFRVTVKNFPNGGILKVLFVLIQDHKRKILLLPCNFDPKEHVKSFPPLEYGFESEHKFNIDKMNYFLGLISEIPANNKDLITENGFIPIHSVTIRDHIKDYLQYVNYLTTTGVILSDNTYIVGEKSKGYKWSEQFDYSEFIIYNQLDIDVHDNQTHNPNKLANDYVYLYYWYEQRKLKIDTKLAGEYAGYLKQYKLQNKSYWDKNDKGELKNPISQYHAILNNIGKLSIFDYNTKIDENIHRLHSVLSNMQKDFRNFLTYDNKTLVSIDIKNSQPYLACLIMNPEFWKENSNLPLKLNSLPNNILSKLNEFSLSIMIGKFFNGLSGDEFEEYKQLVSSGKMYETIIEEVLNKTGKIITRKEAKTNMFTILFSSNRGVPFNSNKYLTDFYSNKFPYVSDLFRIIKTSFKGGGIKQHNRLACLLQSIESEIVLHRCCNRIWEERNQTIPVFTIHDSIITTLENQEYVYSIMLEELTNYIGVCPSLEIEEWNLQKISK